jgi:hypothetical protein
MTEQEFRDMIAVDLVRIVTTDRQFHVVTTHPNMCGYDVEVNLGHVGVAIGWVRCWDLSRGEWHSIDPSAIYAWERLNHPLLGVQDSEHDLLNP